MRVHPGGFRVVLAGPKVSRILPFLQGHGFVGDGYATGAEALAAIRAAPCHVLLLELELGDMMGVDLARTGKSEGIVGATLLLEDPIKAGMILSALARGVDSFVPTPPDQVVLLGKLEQLLLAQWGVAVTGQQQALNDEIARLRIVQATLESELRDERAARASELKEERAQRSTEKKNLERQLGDERKKVRDLVGEIAVLRDQLSTMHLLTGAKTGASDEGAAAPGFGSGDGEEETTDSHKQWEIAPTRNGMNGPTGPGSVDGDFENAATMALPADVAAAAFAADQGRTVEVDKRDALKAMNEVFGDDEASAVPASVSFSRNDEQTAPGGHMMPSEVARAPVAAKVAPKAKTNVGIDTSLLDDLNQMPLTAGDEEVLFLDDD